MFFFNYTLRFGQFGLMAEMPLRVFAWDFCEFQRISANRYRLPVSLHVSTEMTSLFFNYTMSKTK